MDIEEVSFQGSNWTWANNWAEEGYIEVRLDRFFGAAQWLLDHTTTIMKHVEKQSSDHSQLILDTKLEQGRRKTIFYFDDRWVNKSGVEEFVIQAWKI